MSEPRLVEVRRNVLKQNDVIARSLREQFRAAGVFVVSLVSSPGSGKTTFLEKTLTRLQPRYRVAALVGDLATENDAVRLARSKAPVKQITTGTLCHLEAAMVQNALQDWDLHQLDFLFIENVGNLVCPSSYDLGENLRLVLLSLIAEKPRHGYDLIKVMEERYGGFYRPSPGSVYPTLQLLEDEGHLRSETIDGKRTYSITESGKKMLAEREQEYTDLGHDEERPWRRGFGGFAALLLDGLVLGLEFQFVNLFAPEELGVARFGDADFA